MTHEPFAKKRTAEAILSVVVVYDVLPFEFCDGLFNGRSAKDMRRVKECAGENLLPAAFGDGTENAGLLSGKLLDCKCEVVVFPSENDSKSLLDVGFFECRPVVAHLPERVAELLDKAGRVACGAGDCVEHLAREFSSARGKALLDECEEFVWIDVPDLERGGRMVERTGILEEYLRHLVPYAAEENVRSVGVELNPRPQHGERPFAVVDVEYVLELVEKDTCLTPLGLCQKHVEHGVERCRFGGDPRVNSYRRRAGRRVYGNRRPEMREQAYGLGYPAFGIFKACKGGDKPAADVRLVAYAEEICMEEGDVLHVAHGFENEGRLSGSAITLHDDVLPRLYARGEFALKRRTWAEEVSIDSAAVFEWVHRCLSFSGYCAKWYCAKRCCAIWHNAGSIAYYDGLWQWGINPYRCDSMADFKKHDMLTDLKVLRRVAGGAARELRLGRRGLEQIGVRAGVGEREDEYVVLNVIEKKPIVLDMAVAESFKVAGKRMILILGRQSFSHCEGADNGRNLFDVLSPLKHLFEAFPVAGGRADSVLHASMNSSILSGSVHVGALGSLATSLAS